MSAKRCPFHDSSRPRQIVGNSLLTEALPTGQATVERNTQQRELYALCEHLIGKVWGKVDSEIKEFPPALLTDFFLVDYKLSSREGLRRLRPGELQLLLAGADDPLEELQSAFGLTVESVLSRTLHELEEQRDPVWLRFQDVYKEASSFPSFSNTAEQYLLSGLNNAVRTSFAVIRCVQALRSEDIGGVYCERRSLFEDLKASRNFVVHLANTHLVTHRALGNLIWNSSNGSFYVRFFELDAKHGLQLKSEMRDLLPPQVRQEEAAHPEMLHERMGCPALRAGTNVVSKFYDWVLGTLQDIPPLKLRHT
jgi:hypothetical protein